MTGSHICLGANDCMGSQYLEESLATMTPDLAHTLSSLQIQRDMHL